MIYLASYVTQCPTKMVQNYVQGQSTVGLVFFKYIFFLIQDYCPL